MEALLKELRAINESMVKDMKVMDLEFTSKYSTNEIWLDHPIDVGVNGAYIGFKSLFMYYSIPNISNKNNNFRYRTPIADDWNTINLATGSYEIESIAARIQDQIKSATFYNVVREDTSQPTPVISIKPDLATGKSIVEVPDKCLVDFTTENSIGSVLGFDKVVLGAGIHVSDNIVNIMSINSINVCCSIAQGSTVNGHASDRLFTFFPDESPGYKINREARNIVYYPVHSDKIQKISVKLVDQDGNLIDNRGDEITIILSLKY